MGNIKTDGKFRVVNLNLTKPELKLLEHEAAKWLNRDTLRSVDWLAADRLILDKIEELL